MMKMALHQNTKSLVNYGKRNEAFKYMIFLMKNLISD